MFYLFHDENRTDQDQITQEINLIGGMEHRWGKLDYTLGYFYFSEEQSQHNTSGIFGIVDSDSYPAIKNSAHAVFGYLSYASPCLDKRLAFGIDFDTNSGGIFPWVVQYFGEPRTFGIDLTYTFGSFL